MVDLKHLFKKLWGKNVRSDRDPEGLSWPTIPCKAGRKLKYSDVTH